MTLKDMIQQEIEKLPNEVLTEVLDFIQFLKLKQERSLLTKGAQETYAPPISPSIPPRPPESPSSPAQPTSITDGKVWLNEDEIDLLGI